MSVVCDVDFDVVVAVVVVGFENVVVVVIRNEWDWLRHNTLRRARIIVTILRVFFVDLFGGSQVLFGTKR